MNKIFIDIFFLILAIFGGHFLIAYIIKLSRKEFGITANYPKISKWVGMVERAIYTGSWLIGYQQFIPIWLGLKMAGEWGNWDSKKQENRLVFLHQLTFGGISLIVSVLCALLAKSIQGENSGITFPFSFEHNFTIDSVFLFATALIALLAFRSTHRQAQLAELSLRPYIQVAWESKPQGEDRIRQGVRNTCIKLRNVGKSMMREVNYSIKIDKVVIPVKNHTLIAADGHPTCVVYIDPGDKRLGWGSMEKRSDISDDEFNRNDLGYLGLENNEIVKSFKYGELTIDGTYEDIERNRYHFNFQFDPSQQSWFKESNPQTKIGD